MEAPLVKPVETELVETTQDRFLEPASASERRSKGPEPVDAASPLRAPTAPGWQDRIITAGPWRPRRAGSTNVLDRLPRRSAVDQVRQVITDGIAAEGPIHRDRLAKLTAEAFGLTRVVASRAQAILACVPDDAVITEDAFYWPPTADPTQWRSVRTMTPPTARSTTSASPSSPTP